MSQPCCTLPLHQYSKIPSRPLPLVVLLPDLKGRLTAYNAMHFKLLSLSSLITLTSAGDTHKRATTTLLMSKLFLLLYPICYTTVFSSVIYSSYSSTARLQPLLKYRLVTERNHKIINHLFSFSCWFNAVVCQLSGPPAHCQFTMHLREHQAHSSSNRSFSYLKTLTKVMEVKILGL